MRIAFVATLLLALPLPTLAYQEHGGQADDRLVREYTRFAGSKSNAESLVNGLRNDTQVKLTSNGRTTTFTPPTSKMGYGNVDIALSLAKASLAEEGIRNPTPEQIKAALNGGTVTTKSGQRVALPGVLKQRASGMGWGKVAQANGFKLGEVMRDKGHRHGHKHGDWKHDRGDYHKARYDRPERPHKIDRPERFERPERPEKPERHHRR
jgi:hypothetical protein